jgi:hypothetical protein
MSPSGNLREEWAQPLFSNSRKQSRRFKLQLLTTTRAFRSLLTPSHYLTGRGLSLFSAGNSGPMAPGCLAEPPLASVGFSAHIRTLCSRDPVAATARLRWTTLADAGAMLLLASWPLALRAQTD